MELKIEQVTKTYGAKHALNQFSVVLKEGIYGLLGPNGAGKSTLMNIITDNLAATSGTVYWEGKKIQSLGKQYREILGYMPQQQGMYDEFTVEHFLWYMASLKGMKRKDAKEQINQLLSVVNMTQNRKKLLKGLSGGMKQRVLLAQALLNDPKILILDEPTAGLDPKERIRIRNLISEIALNKIVLLATHVVSDIEYTAKELILMNEGVLIAKDTPSNLIKMVTNQVWELKVKEADLKEIAKKYKVSNIIAEEDGIVVRIIEKKEAIESQWNPVMVRPNLEDLYLYLFQ
ncbi:MAG TPA: ABC transporter ATP-binding protein [Candidatus Fimimorpha faecalis]|uniref:ABC transporter ATP-binding protein n=1 Tax=Candidatus Fimimorpha faecalis TaxID=2840824 RepID=A0A9D1EGW2_9FIRM|nr:ABC transporter ATP-binding protein [Candidatus Fimimorpha faecalis]